MILYYYIFVIQYAYKPSLYYYYNYQGRLDEQRCAVCKMFLQLLVLALLWGFGNSMQIYAPLSESAGRLYTMDT